MTLQAGAGGEERGRTARGRLQEAEAFARQAIEADPALPEAYTTLGVVLSTSGRKADAIDSWKRAVGARRPRSSTRSTT